MPVSLPNEIQDAILGTIITYPAEIDTAAAILQPEDFFTIKHRETFSWMLMNRDKSFDFPTLAHGLKGKVDASFLADWAANDTIPAFLPRYCYELKDAARVIKLHDLASSIRGLCEQHKDYAEIREYIDSQLSQIGLREKTDSLKCATELVLETTNRMQERRNNNGELPGISFGWDDLDSATTGMNKGDLIVIGGRPSMGKTALALNIGSSVALAGHTALIFSLEMGRDQIMDRIAASVGRINFQNIRSGSLADNEWPRMTKAMEQLYRSKLLIDDSPSLSLADVRAKCRKIKANDGLNVVIIDYLQLMKMSSKENRNHAIGEVTRGLKQLAREIDVSIILLSQLNRAVDSRQDKRPTMADLRESGEIEQDTDLILFPFRPAAYCEKCRDHINDSTHDTRRHQAVAELIIAKQRNGNNNLSLPMIWLGQYQRFEQKQGGS